ncbi:AAA family ATPase [Burkholderia sp. Ac-20365]|uniref:AAA family ATPase n=1 Tax=Burkholderia sp. Ac-20365 TaxID=2703897 RepID=UPI00197BD17F|nr:AAA family ATPase [Burkholderia sp. Ac-20365]MBN3762324.1 AAA family ATPase [Burkholderia sp. Ac-20365]
MDSTNGPRDHSVTARYIEQEIPQYKGNPLIEALPPLWDIDKWCEFLLQMPEFDPEQRKWPAGQRLCMLESLLNFLVPLDRHIRLACAVDCIIREGYVGRGPRTAHHVTVLQQLYEAKQSGHVLRPDGKDEQDYAQRSSSLIGVSGMGKTSSLKKILKRYFRVIEHPDFDGHIQIPWLHIEAPPDGMNAKELALSICRQIYHLRKDIAPLKEFPFHGYQTEPAIMNNAARLMHLAHVGLLVVDEIHRLKSIGTGKSKLLNLLVAASNELGIPVLFVGTSKSLKLLGLDFSPGRRSVGSGFMPWNVLETSRNFDPTSRGEWEHFITAIWKLQWLRTFTPLTEGLSKTMFAYSQGIVDIALKLFMAVQQDAIFDESEAITAQGIKNAWERHFVLVHPMIAALEAGDLKALETYGDIAPITISSLSAEARSLYHGPRDPLASLRPGDARFAPAIAAELVNRGFSVQCAFDRATQVAAQEKTRDVKEGVKAAFTCHSRSGKRKYSEDSIAAKSPSSPADYRNAILAAKEEGCTIFSKLCDMGAVFDFDALLE